MQIAAARFLVDHSATHFMLYHSAIALEYSVTQRTYGGMALRATLSKRVLFRQLISISAGQR